MRDNLKKARRSIGLSQQNVADLLGVDLRYYKYIESGERLGAIWLWDLLEDITGVHQRELRELSETYPCQEDNQLTH